MKTSLMVSLTALHIAALAATGPEELIVLARTQPIPITGGPPNCSVAATERYCRTDKTPIKQFTVLEQRVSGSSKINSIQLNHGCLVVDATLSMPKSRDPKYACEGGEARFSLKVQLSTKPLP